VNSSACSGFSSSQGTHRCWARLGTSAWEEAPYRENENEVGY
jgi:hypothetical protein